MTWPQRGDPRIVGSIPPSILADGELVARQTFATALFADHGLTPIAKHWFSNHFEAGKDGSVLVVDHVARQVSNLLGPAVLSKDDTTTAVVDGRIWHGPRNRYDGPLQPGVDLPEEPASAEEAASEPDYAPTPR